MQRVKVTFLTKSGTSPQKTMWVQLPPYTTIRFSFSIMYFFPPAGQHFLLSCLGKNDITHMCTKMLKGSARLWHMAQNFDTSAHVQVSVEGAVKVQVFFFCTWVGTSHSMHRCSAGHCQVLKGQAEPFGTSAHAPVH